jgi:hypothetical protein
VSSLRAFFISLGVSFEVVRRLKTDENQFLSRERTDEQSTNEVEMLVTTPAYGSSQNTLLLAIVVLQFSTLLLRH